MQNPCVPLSPSSAAQFTSCPSGDATRADMEEANWSPETTAGPTINTMSRPVHFSRDPFAYAIRSLNSNPDLFTSCAIQGDLSRHLCFVLG